MNQTMLYRWIPTAFIITALTGLVYISVQQTLRQSANDPQIQMAEDATALLNRGDALSFVVPQQKIDLAASLAPYVIVYNEQGSPLASSGYLNDSIPVPPIGVLTHSIGEKDNRVTWQPQLGVRQAVVVTHFSNTSQSGFVLAGRSLREVEKREGFIEMYALLAWLVTLAGSYGLMIFLEKLKRADQI